MHALFFSVRHADYIIYCAIELSFSISSYPPSPLQYFWVARPACLKNVCEDGFKTFKTDKIVNRQTIQEIGDR